MKWTCDTCGYAIEAPEDTKRVICRCYAEMRKQQLFDRISVLYLHNRDGGLVGYFYHPNREAVEKKMQEEEALFANLEFPVKLSIVNYMRADAARAALEKALEGCVGGHSSAREAADEVLRVLGGATQEVGR